MLAVSLAPTALIDDAMMSQRWHIIDADDGSVEAEIATPGGRRPDDAYAAVRDKVFTCWPTKLAFAPRVAELVLAGLQERGLKPSGGRPALAQYPTPPLARLPWDEVRQWT